MKRILLSLFLMPLLAAAQIPTTAGGFAMFVIDKPATFKDGQCLAQLVSDSDSATTVSQPCTAKDTPVGFRLIVKTSKDLAAGTYQVTWSIDGVQYPMKKKVFVVVRK